MRGLFGWLGWMSSSTAAMLLALGILSATPSQSKGAGQVVFTVGAFLVATFEVGGAGIAEYLGNPPPPQCPGDYSPPPNRRYLGCHNPGGQCRYVGRPSTCGNSQNNNGCTCQRA